MNIARRHRVMVAQSLLVLWSVLVLACAFAGCGLLVSDHAHSESVTTDHHLAAEHCAVSDLKDQAGKLSCDQTLAGTTTSTQTLWSFGSSLAIVPVLFVLALISQFSQLPSRTTLRRIPVATPLPTTLRFHRYTI